MSARTEVHIERPYSRYGLEDPSRISAFLPPESKNDPAARQTVIDTIVAISVIDGQSGVNMHKENARTLGISKDMAYSSFMKQFADGTFKFGNRFDLAYNDTPLIAGTPTKLSTR